MQINAFMMGNDMQRAGSRGVITHGLRNNDGENNCFINSVIQILWHLDIFRVNFERRSNNFDHVCPEVQEKNEDNGNINDEILKGDNCLVCALSGLFLNFRYSNQATLPPEYVRKALAGLYASADRFQLGKMDSAIECYEALLKGLDNQGVTLTSKIFSYSVCETTVCPCGASSEPFISAGHIFYVSVDDFLSLKRDRTMYNSKNGRDFGNVLKDCLQQGKSPCPDEEATKCKNIAKTQTTLLKAPRVLTLSLSWASSQADRSLVLEVIQSVGQQIDVTKAFNYNMDELEGAGDIYKLSGIVAYYGRHYVAFVYHTSFRKWISCDDSTFKTVGSWSNVVDRFKTGKWQPELLVYTSRYVDIE
mmetsp:Transcript_34808/g.42941  ORF Transcript_34808/g.42941 Transcript_34808/m.42941 type:complete len:362 (+) Transcript_34808:162-1247(+)